LAPQERGNDERVVVREDDFENIVDTYSDDEGDEVAGAAARRDKDASEEKARHEEVSGATELSCC